MRLTAGVSGRLHTPPCVMAMDLHDVGDGQQGAHPAAAPLLASRGAAPRRPLRVLTLSAVLATTSRPGLLAGWPAGWRPSLSARRRAPLAALFVGGAVDVHHVPVVAGHAPRPLQRHALVGLVRMRRTPTRACARRRTERSAVEHEAHAPLHRAELQILACFVCGARARERRAPTASNSARAGEGGGHLTGTLCTPRQCRCRAPGALARSCRAPFSLTCELWLGLAENLVDERAGKAAGSQRARPPTPPALLLKRCCCRGAPSHGCWPWIGACCCGRLVTPGGSKEASATGPPASPRRGWAGGPAGSCRRRGQAAGTGRPQAAVG